MKNSVKIEVKYPSWLKNKNTSDIKTMLALSNLEAAHSSIATAIETDIPVSFPGTIELTITLKSDIDTVKVDYSKIKSAQEQILLKSYLSGNMKSFYKEFAKL